MRILRCLKGGGEKDHEHEWEVDIVGSRKCAVCGEPISLQKRKRCKLCGKEEIEWESIRASILEPVASGSGIHICVSCVRYYVRVERELEKILDVVPARDLTFEEVEYPFTVLIFKDLADVKRWLERRIAYRSKIFKDSFMGVKCYMFYAKPRDPRERPYVVLIHKMAVAREARNRWLTGGA